MVSIFGEDNQRERGEGGKKGGQSQLAQRGPRDNDNGQQGEEENE